jgi:dTDP-4-amino-4,6-dideoxygalactose transaminase
LTTSGTDALELAALLLNIRSGDEVIVPSYTFVSTVNAFVLRGATPVFVDIRPDTLNLDERQLEAKITPNTRAIVPVHYAGVGCEMDAICAVAKPRGVAVVEDNAHGLGGAYRARPLGSMGLLAAHSFHETKNLSCGEGGALAINELGLLTRAEVLREKGTDRSRFLRGEVDKYTWTDVGSSFLPSDILAAVLSAQLESMETIQRARAAVWHRYEEALTDWARTRGVRLPHVPPHCRQAYHMFYMVMPDQRARQGLLSHLRARGIAAGFHYVPLHSSPMGRSFGYRPGQFPVTESISEQIVRLPFFTSLAAEEQTRAIEAVLSFR